MKNKYCLNDLPQSERPRERLKNVGIDNLSLQELLALVIEKGGRGSNVFEVSQRLLSCFGSLQKMKQASISELQKVKGIGFATACKLKAAFKLGEKSLTPFTNYKEKIDSAEKIFKLLRYKLGNKKKEHFYLLSVDTRNYLISIDQISVGSLNSSIAHPREIFKTAIKNSAAAIILVHNHPSGETNPSSADRQITRKLAQAGSLLNIPLLDHLIICESQFMSFKSKRFL